MSSLLASTRTWLCSWRYPALRSGYAASLLLDCVEIALSSPWFALARQPRLFVYERQPSATHDEPPIQQSGTGPLYFCFLHTLDVRDATLGVGALSFRV
ncbi:unnamed protein product [Vitrella brassicaformis CCMP3155]|uniref:Uncharacterized protein n=1 Tax=Vitrella brassicaformis (strain CCMP3155) TaxID=1169540 RepID=A0A0G4FCN1_VITBC|nr:unnamed protein product [Vitrella brassicaformis CCMP3155]|eukprot:CEM10989.1 unnamed protein product [Vitrella brassicaformis CCMP3155]